MNSNNDQIAREFAATLARTGVRSPTVAGVVRGFTWWYKLEADEMTAAEIEAVAVEVVRIMEVGK